MRKLINLVGQQFGRLIAGERGDNDKYGHPQWNCTCSCGNHTVVNTKSLRTGATRSCGCWRREVTTRTKTTHGQKRHGKVTPEYQAYVHAKGRCVNPRDAAWSDYGGRGIEFVFESFDEFYAHIGPKPSPTLHLDRIDNNGNYEIGNVRWASKLESARNRRSTKLSESKVKTIRSKYATTGVTQETLAVEYGVDRATIGNVVRGRTWATLPLPPKKPSTSVTSVVAEKVG